MTSFTPTKVPSPFVTASGPAVTADSALDSSADTFAEQGLDTMRKRAEPPAADTEPSHTHSAVALATPAKQRLNDVSSPSPASQTIPSTTAGEAVAAAAVASLSTASHRLPTTTPHVAPSVDRRDDNSQTSSEEPPRNASVAARAAAFEASSGNPPAPFVPRKPRRM